MEQLIFQLSDDPNLELLEAWELERYFHSNNPFWVEEGEPLELENFTREEAINILKTELGNGYSINGDTVAATDTRITRYERAEHRRCAHCAAAYGNAVGYHAIHHPRALLDSAPTAHATAGPSGRIVGVQH